jgi:hypothetical protein
VAATLTSRAIINKARNKATNKTKTNVVDTDEVQHVRAWDPKWDNRDRETTKIATTTSNVLLTLPGAKLKMRW